MASNQLTPFVFSNPVDFLRAVRQHYGERKKPISLQKWAQKLGYRGSRSLELILSGNRLPSEEMLFKLGKDLKLSVVEEKYLALLVKREKLLLAKKPAHEIEMEMSQLRPARFEAQYIDNEIFRRVSEWYPLVIRQLALTPKFQKDIAWISKKLRGKVSQSQIAASLAEWENLVFDRRSLYTAEDVPSQAVRTFHKKMLHKAVEAMDEFSVDDREYISITFRGSKNKIADMKKTLRQIRDQFNDDFTSEEGNEVFQLCLALFPHTDLKS
ncbi:MAG: DUF4423 domain-containing protein [Pseudobdellovibrionaceae bacterium]